MILLVLYMKRNIILHFLTKRNATVNRLDLQLIKKCFAYH